MATLSDITLIMPTYNRVDYAVRTMRFWSDRGVTVHVLDGGAVPMSRDILDSLGSNVRYHHLPYSMYERVVFATMLLETKYCALIEDDSFLLVDGLKHCLRELEDNPQLVSCTGRCMAFKVVDGDVCGKIQYPEFETHDVMDANPLTRIEEHLKSFTPTTVYSLMRASAWKHAMSVLGDRKFLSARMGELPFEICAAYHGRAKVLPTALRLRSIENESHPVEGGPRPLADWWADPSMESARSDLVSKLIAALKPAEPAADVEVALRRALDGYSRHCKQLEAAARPPVLASTRAARLRKRFFGWLPRGLKNYVLRTLWPAHYRPYRPLLAVADDLVSRGIAVDAGNLAEVIKIVKTFHGRRRALA